MNILFWILKLFFTKFSNWLIDSNILCKFACIRIKFIKAKTIKVLPKVTASYRIDFKI